MKCRTRILTACLTRRLRFASTRQDGKVLAKCPPVPWRVLPASSQAWSSTSSRSHFTTDSPFPLQLRQRSDSNHQIQFSSMWSRSGAVLRMADAWEVAVRMLPCRAVNRPLDKVARPLCYTSSLWCVEGGIGSSWETPSDTGRQVRACLARMGASHTERMGRILIRSPWAVATGVEHFPNPSIPPLRLRKTATTRGGTWGPTRSQMGS
jgi:hypothetical protein